MDFGQAIVALKSGHRAARDGWNGKGMFIVLMPELRLPPYSTEGTELSGASSPIHSLTFRNCRPYLALFDSAGEWQPGWNASQADMLADDWTVVEG